MITIACSMRLLDKANDLAARLRDTRREVTVPMARGNDSMCRVCSEFLNAIAGSTYLYVLAHDGVVGLGVAAEIGYARGLGVPIFASEPLVDENIAWFVRETMAPDAFVEYVASR